MCYNVFLRIYDFFILSPFLVVNCHISLFIELDCKCSLEGPFLDPLPLLQKKKKLEEKDLTFDELAAKVD